ncbi:MAG TPA: hypothetical protein VH592_17745 [Gemmataceae bacterium]|jgi:hypothetical protein
MIQLNTMRQTAELIGVTYAALQAAIFHKKIPEPEMKVGSHKLFNAEEVEIARKHFEENRKRREARRRS